MMMTMLWAAGHFGAVYFKLRGRHRGAVAAPAE